jgi:hypothetical protein
VATLTPSFVAELSRSLSRAYTRHEKARRMIIPSSSRVFLETVIDESLVLRAKEWQSKRSIDCDDAQEIRKAIPEVIGHLETILKNANLDDIDGAKHLLAIGILEYIKGNWCGIFPFCR